MIRNKDVKHERIPTMDEPRLKSMLYKNEKTHPHTERRKTFIQLFKGGRPTSQHPYKT